MLCRAVRRYVNDPFGTRSAGTETNDAVPRSVTFPLLDSVQRKTTHSRISSGTRNSSSGEQLANDPGLAGVEQLGEVALPPLLLGDLQLLGHQVVVDRALDVAEDPDRGAAVRRLRHARQRERQRRLRVARVVDEHAVLAGGA